MREAPKTDLPYSHLCLRPTLEPISSPFFISIHLLSNCHVPATPQHQGFNGEWTRGTDLFLVELFDWMHAQLSRCQASTPFPIPGVLMYSHLFKKEFVSLLSTSPTVPALKTSSSKNFFLVFPTVNKCCPLLDYWQKYQRLTSNSEKFFLKLGLERTLLKSSGELDAWEGQLACLYLMREESNSMEWERGLKSVLSDLFHGPVFQVH